MIIQKDIAALLEANVISEETAEKIRTYYKDKEKQSYHRLFSVFGILGAILVGLGIILIIAHNWDELSRTTKACYAFLPLLIGQGACAYILTKKHDSLSWRESGAAFLFFAVGASISLISQIYNISGSLSSFMLVWMMLCLPLVYVMKSSIASLLYLIGITFYGVETGYWSYPSSEDYLYWLLLLAILPHHYLLFKHKPESNFLVFHDWLIPVSILIMGTSLTKSRGDLMFVAYVSLFGLLYQIGNHPHFRKQKLRKNAYQVLGSLGTLGMLLTLSFDWFWKEIRTKDFIWQEIIVLPEFWSFILLTLLAAGLLLKERKSKTLEDIKPLEMVFLLVAVLFMLKPYPFLAVALINCMVLATGILTIRKGTAQNHLGVLNYGLLIVTSLVVCRFFDTHISFVVRGLLFMAVGLGFFVTNYWMLQKRKINA